MNLRDLRIGARLALGFGLILTLMAVAVALAVGLNNSQRQAARQALATAAAKQHLTGEMRAALLESAVAMRNVALASAVTAAEQQANKARGERKRYASARDAFEALGLGSDEQALMRDIAVLDKSVEQPFFQAVSLAQAMSTDDAIQVISTQIDPVQQKQIQAIHRLQALQQEASEQVQQGIQASATRLNLSLGVLALAAVALGAFLAWRITRSVTGPLEAAVRVADRVTEGDLAMDVPVNGADEAAQLLAALHRMTVRLRDVVSGVRDTAGVVSRTAHDIAAGHGDLSARTESQATSLEQTAATMEQLTATVRKTAENAQSAHSLSVDASQVATQGREVVAQVVQMMEAIHRSSGRIAEINAVIDGIAFQTNILALNAAVEAARAGEEGRGFAVVASEVRQLAQRSATAAREIKQLIVESADQSAGGTRLVADAGQTMGHIVDSVERVRAIISHITTAAQEQSLGITQVNEAIAHIDGVTQQNAGLVETATSSATQLRDRADELMSAVSVFHVAA